MPKPLFNTSREAWRFLKAVADHYGEMPINEVVAQLAPEAGTQSLPEDHQIYVYDRDDVRHCEDCGADEISETLRQSEFGLVCGTCYNNAAGEWRHQMTGTRGKV